MSLNTVTACSTVKCTGTALHCDRKNVPCTEYKKTVYEKLCASMPTEIEALAALDDLIAGHHGGSTLKMSSCVAEGEPTIGETENFEGIISCAWRGLKSLIAEGLIGSALRAVGSNPAPKGIREYPNPPARLR